jgi:replicative DNA helicase
MAGPLRSRREIETPEPGALTPPHSVEAEQAVLGGLLIDALAWDQVGDLIVAEDFYRPDHQLIYGALGELIAGGKPADVVTVAEQLERHGRLEAAGGLAYLGTLARDTPTAANVRAYAQIVRERSLLRRLISAGRSIAAAALASDGRAARELVDEAEKQVFAIAEQSTGRRDGAIKVSALLPPLIDKIDEWHTNPNSMRGLPTGFTDFDRKTGGLRPGDLVIIAGRPSMGKTTLAMNIAEYVAVNPGTRSSVAIFSMEMPSEQLLTRMLASIGGVALNSIRSGQISDEDWVRVTAATSQLSEARIFLDESAGLTPTELRARARRVAREHGLDLIVVDYLQLMQVPGTKENRATEIAEISRGLKALAKELQVPVIALSQLNRGVEQRNEKKPVMSDLRECVTGDTLVCLQDGRRVPIRDLEGSTPEVWSIDERQRIVAARSDKVWRVGSRPVFMVQLASGRSIRATAEHRMLAAEGWTAVAALKPGDRLGLARRIPQPQAVVRWPEHWLVLLGHLVGDGSYLSHQPLRYTTSSEANSEAVRCAAEAFGSTVSRRAGRGAWHQLVIGGNGNRWHPAGVGAWLKQLGIFGQRSHEKHLPPDVFTLGDEQLALLLKHLWATDGCVALRKQGQRGMPRVYFSTCSARLADDVSALLLRLGIVARRRAVHKANYRPVYTVDVSGMEAQLRFAALVGGFGPRAAAIEALAAHHAEHAARANTNVDTLPLAVFSRVRALLHEQGVTTRQMARLRGTSYGGSSHFRFAPSRTMLHDYARLLQSEELQTWATSDLYWDRIVAIVPDGEADVFDLTVPGPANWMADGLVTHNSGAIEQDADLILLIYRDEVYDKNTTKRGIAEIDLAKHRNGEIGTFVLTFQGQFSRFANYAAESYAEGVLR